MQIELLPRMINVTEGQDFTFEVVKQSGFSFGAIPFWILPLTYAQFEARNFSLDELFPMRPPSAASEGLLPAIICVDVGKNRRFEPGKCCIQLGGCFICGMIYSVGMSHSVMMLHLVRMLYSVVMLYSMGIFYSVGMLQEMTFCEDVIFVGMLLI